MSDFERDEQQQETPTSVKRRRGRPSNGERKPKAPRPSTGRPRGRPTTGLLTVACPRSKCEAAVGVMCRTASGKVLAAGHEERRALAGLAPRKKWKGSGAEGDKP